MSTSRTHTRPYLSCGVVVWRCVQVYQKVLSLVTRTLAVPSTALPVTLLSSDMRACLLQTDVSKVGMVLGRGGRNKLEIQVWARVARHWRAFGC